MRIRTAVVALAVTVSACSGTGDASTSTASTSLSPATAAPSTSGTPATTESPATTTSTISNAPPTTTATPPKLESVASGAGVALATSEECTGPGDPVDGGTLTWTDGERIWEGELDGEVRCLFHVEGIISSMEWGPQGDRILINEQLIVGGPVSGQVVPRDVDWSFTYPSGLNLVGLQNGTVIKWNTNGDKEEILTPITTHTAVAYHPSGLHIAVGGTEQPEDADFDPTEGVFIAKSDGTDPVNLILGFGTEIRDIRFANDGSQMYFIAEHDGLVHFHSVSTIPDDVEGTQVLGAGAEEFATTHATASGGGRIDFSELLVHPTLPGIAAWTTPECEPTGSRGFQVVAGEDASLVQAIGPASAIGFLNSDPTTVIVAAVSGPCDGPRDLGLMAANLETGELDNLPVAGDVIAAAVRTIATPHIYDLVDVVIAGFA